MQININITLDNVSSEVDANQIANTIESLVKQYTHNEVRTRIYDNEGTRNGNPLMTHQLMEKIK